MLYLTAILLVVALPYGFSRPQGDLGGLGGGASSLPGGAGGVPGGGAGGAPTGAGAPTGGAPGGGLPAGGGAPGGGLPAGGGAPGGGLPAGGGAPSGGLPAGDGAPGGGLPAGGGAPGGGLPVGGGTTAASASGAPGGGALGGGIPGGGLPTGGAPTTPASAGGALGGASADITPSPGAGGPTGTGAQSPGGGGGGSSGGSIPSGAFFSACQPVPGQPGTFTCKYATTIAELSSGGQGESLPVSGGNKETGAGGPGGGSKDGAGGAGGTGGADGASGDSSPVLCVKNGSAIALTDASGKVVNITGKWTKHRCEFGAISAFVVKRTELLPLAKQCQEKGFEVPQPSDPENQGSPFEFDQEKGGPNQLLGFYHKGATETFAVQPPTTVDKCDK